MKLNLQVPEVFDFLFKPLRNKVSYGGRGAAKSESYSSALIIAGMQSKEKILCCREFQSSISDSVKALLDRKILENNLQFFYESTDKYIRGKNGTEFIFAGIKQNPSKIKSIDSVTKCWVEEGQNISQDSLDILIPTIRAKNSEIWISMNTGTKDDPIYKYYITNTPPDSVVKKINYYDNPFFPEVLRREMEYCKRHDIDKYNHIWLGEPQNISNAAIFRGKVKIERFIAPKDAVFYYGLDFGFAESPLCFLRCYIDETNRNLYIDKGGMSTGIEIEDTPSWMEQTIQGCKRWYIKADSARPEMISYLYKKGFNVFASKKGPGSVEDGIDFIKNYTIIIHESLKDIIYEFLNYMYQVDKHTNNIIPKPEKKNDNAPDALRYALENYNSKVDYKLIIP